MVRYDSLTLSIMISSFVELGKLVLTSTENSLESPKAKSNGKIVETNCETRRNLVKKRVFNLGRTVYHVSNIHPKNHKKGKKEMKNICRGCIIENYLVELILKNF